MSEQVPVPPEPDTDDEQRGPQSGTDTGRPGNVRTQGETAVDEAMGAGDNVH
jgi:hypothetical protein